MELKSKTFIITNAKGEEINVKKHVVALDLNGERIDIKFKDIASNIEFDSGEIYCNSLLSYYKVNEDGSLEVEGSKVQLVDETINEPILVKAIEKPTIHDNGNIPFEHVQKFAEFFKIAKPEEIFTNLSDTEKQSFISAREAAAPPPVEEIAPESGPDAAALELEAKNKANADLKASINPSYLQEKAAYIATQGFYAGVKFKEYIKDQFHLFYGSDAAHEPCVLIKHGEWWEEVTEENTEIIDKTDKTVVISFKGVNQKGKITLDTETGDINITDLE